LRVLFLSTQVRKQVQALKLIISGLQAKAKDRQWLKNQTMGEEGVSNGSGAFAWMINRNWGGGISLP
jgi:hypothetical protein